MADKEKVIKGLECCTQHGSMCGRDCNGHWGWTDGSHTGMELLGEYRTKCTYGNCETGCVKTLTKDTLALLKAQEPVKPVPAIDDVGDWLCGNCYQSVVGEEELDASGFVPVKFNYCPNCGQAVKWE